MSVSSGGGTSYNHVLRIESSEAPASSRHKRSYGGVLEAESSDASAQDFHSIKCRKVGSMSHRTPPDSRLDDQQFINHLMNNAAFADSTGRYTDAVAIYLQLLDLYTANMLKCERKNGVTNRGPHSGWILSCFNLTRCYLKLNHPQAASDILQQAWNPDSSLAIPATHPKYLELSHLYFEIEDRLQNSSNTKKYMTEKNNALHLHQEFTPESCQDEFTINDILDLVYMYGQDFLSREQSQDAILLLEGEISRITAENKLYESKLKERIVKIHLLLAEVYLHVGQPLQGEEILKRVWDAESRFYINHLDKNYLWMAQLYRQTSNKEQCDTTSCRHRAQKGREPTLYKRLALTPMAIPAKIKSHWKSCMLYFHPDKGGHTGVAQQITAAATVLLDPESRRRYDLKINA
ncbi:uncharacterized protein MELLADRAFT_87785 [Melampsora larici-populina 98AG31]|uniref:J domain-containing protein n=1 Tax=Melampsora larici-populina (strain 98AG31 / pathotype 3-4-7) TaxID=747676 RepID=F4RPG6_MELLP|nr:uncharacterized protein MELLADRAFT_87785 [Melampsora larici-populina 98AG31]EGG05724.1 hypothetical protein MELLADRAFT_87785 [Melampsora larici-populina 98AG31]